MASVKSTSGQEESTAAIKRLDDIVVVDADVHDVNPDTSEFARYMEEPWKSRLLHLTKTDEPLAKAIGQSFHYEFEPKSVGLGDDVHTQSPEGVLAFMDRFKTDFVLLHGHETSMVSNVPDPEYAAAICSAYNDYVLDVYCDGNKGIKSSIRVPPQAPELAAQEIHRLADEKDMVNVHIDTGMNGLFGEPRFEPIYEAAQEEGLAIDYHPTSTNQPWTGQWGGSQLEHSVSAASAYNQMHMSHVPSLIFRGIPEKYPDVTHIFLEQGITWLPWVLGRMDKNYERRKHMYPELTKKPSEYVYDNFLFGTQPIEDPANSATIKKIFDVIDAKNLLVYASDFPHYDFDYPTFLTIPPIDEETSRAVFGENALEVLDI